jgi:hypothetical protein
VASDRRLAAKGSVGRDYLAESLSLKPGIHPRLSETRAMFRACDLRGCEWRDFSRQALTRLFQKQAAPGRLHQLPLGEAGLSRKPPLTRPGLFRRTWGRLIPPDSGHGWTRTGDQRIMKLLCQAATSERPFGTLRSRIIHRCTTLLRLRLSVRIASFFV